MKRIAFRTLKIIIACYAILCALLYFFQEKIIFLPQKLDANHAFQFEQTFEELNFTTSDGNNLNGLLFKADSAKGLIFYLHGNAGNLQSWGNIATVYKDLGYDIFILDYRSYGKSEGTITSQEQLFADNQLAYNQLKKSHSEDKITIIGYSIGTGMAAKLAATNSPNKLILQAPYYSLTDMMKHTYPIVPTFLLKYKFATNEYLKNCSVPIIIFHGDKDRVIYYGSSLKLKSEFKAVDKLITLPGQGHNGITDNELYRAELKTILQ